ncbi:unnamed protein product [Meganyctiphanes norvegica]|uniref:Chromo domain-containing protein n=1 Tax=Meganyctiphanes norvegica TaxID=48144 RepID=A0AAV2S634_MEGNR
MNMEHYVEKQSIGMREIRNKEKEHNEMNNKNEEHYNEYVQDDKKMEYKTDEQTYIFDTTLLKTENIRKYKAKRLVKEGKVEDKEKDKRMDNKIKENKKIHKDKNLDDEVQDIEEEQEILEDKILDDEEEENILDDEKEEEISEDNILDIEMEYIEEKVEIFDDEVEEVEEEEDDHVVERILDKRTCNGMTEYFLKWKGYSNKFNSWEPEDYINAPELIAEFEKQPKIIKRGVGTQIKNTASKLIQDFEQGFKLNKSGLGTRIKVSKTS